MVDRRSLPEKFFAMIGLADNSEKVELDGTDAVNAAATATGFLPGAGQILQPIMAAPATAMEASRNQAWVEENFGVQSFDTQAQIDPLFKKELAAADDMIVSAVASSAAGGIGGAAGGAAGMWAGTQMGATLGSFLGPLGTTLGAGAGFLVGAFAGSTAMSYPVDYILAKPRTDAFSVIGAIQNDLKSGAGVDPRKVFVNLAASLPDDVLTVDPATGENEIEKKLRILSDGKIRSLQEALEKQPEILDRMMHDTSIDNKIKQYNNMLVIGDINDKSGEFAAPTATEMFTAKLSQGVDPRILVLRQKRMQLVDLMNMEVAQEVSAPMMAMSHEPDIHTAGKRDAALEHRKKNAGQYVG